MGSIRCLVTGPPVAFGQQATGVLQLGRLDGAEVGVEGGGAAGVAALGTVFFAALDGPAARASSLRAFGDAFGAVLLVEIALYLVAAGPMLMLPRTTAVPSGRP